MKTHPWGIFSLILFYLTVLPGQAPDAGAFSQPATLRGLKTITVGISELPQELQDIGLKEKDLYRDVIEVLDTTGIQINTMRYPIAGDPEFLVDIFGGEFIQGVITYCIDVRLDQAVVLERDRRIRSNATTWSQKFIGVAGYGTRASVLRNQLKDLAQLFVKEYLTEMSKKRLLPPASPQN